MFEPDQELAAMLAADAELRAELPEEQPPGWVVDSLPAAELDEDQRLDRLLTLERQLARLHAEQVRVLAAIETADDTSKRWSQEVIMCTLRISARAAQKKLTLAATLTNDLPRTLAMLERGDIGARHAEQIAEASWSVLPDVTDAFETSVLAHAPQQSSAELAKAIQRAAIAVDPAIAERRRRTAHADRAVTRQALDDGLAELRLIHTADAIQAVYQRIDAATRLLPTEDPRTRDQQRADLTIDAILAGIPADSLPHLQGRRPSIQVVVTATTLLGYDDQPADLAGYGAITAQHARELAADPTGTWRGLLTDPNTGHLLDAGTATYRPSQRLVDFLTARDDECVFRTCHQPAQRCEIEHCLPFDSGGPTAPHNNAITCKRHNTCKNPTPRSATPPTPTAAPPGPTNPPAASTTTNPANAGHNHPHRNPGNQSHTPATHPSEGVSYRLCK
jgi:hypothetical protein